MSFRRHGFGFVLVVLFMSHPSLEAQDRAGPAEPFTLLQSIDADDGHLQWVAFAPRGHAVAACGDNFVQMYDAKAGTRIRKLHGSASDIARFAFSPNGKMIASASRDGVIPVWNVDTGDIITELRGHSDKITGVNFSADGKWLVSTARQPQDRSIRVWECATWQETAKAQSSQGTNSMYVAFSPNGEHVAASGYRGAIQLFDFDCKQLRLRFERNHRRGEMVPHVTFAPDGASFVTSGWDKTLRCWDVISGDELWKATAPEYARCFEAAVFSPDGSKIYCVTRDETIQARDAKTGELEQSFRWQDQVRGLAISPEGTMLATAGHRGKIKIWQITALR